MWGVWRIDRKSMAYRYTRQIDFEVFLAKIVINSTKY